MTLSVCLTISGPIVADLARLMEALHIRNKLNRLKKYYLAEELNSQSPIELSLEQIERERTNASETTRSQARKQV